jgi:hypothetical protein
MDTLRRKIASVEEVEKATSQIPLALKRIEEAASSHRGSIVQATKQQQADYTKSNNCSTCNSSSYLHFLEQFSVFF